MRAGASFCSHVVRDDFRWPIKPDRGGVVKIKVAFAKNKVCIWGGGGGGGTELVIIAKIAWKFEVPGHHELGRMLHFR